MQNKRQQQSKQNQEPGTLKIMSRVCRVRQWQKRIRRHNVNGYNKDNHPSKKKKEKNGHILNVKKETIAFVHTGCSFLFLYSTNEVLEFRISSEVWFVVFSSWCCGKQIENKAHTLARMLSATIFTNNVW